MPTMVTKILERLFVRDAVGAPRHDVSENLTVIETGKPDYPLILRFQHGGDVEYQRLSGAEIRALHPFLEKEINKDANT